MSIEAMKQAQAAIKSALDFYSAMFGVPVDSMLVTHHSEAKTLFEKCMAAMESLSTAIEQPAQRPIKTFHDGKAWPVQEQAQQEPFGFAVMENPIAPPVQRTWVGLTDEEVDAIYEAHHNQYGECESLSFVYERAIEAKLKEKNT